MQEELETLTSTNLSMRKQIMLAQNRVTNIKEKAKCQYILDTNEMQKQFQEQDRVQQQAIAQIKDQYKKLSEEFKRKQQKYSEQIERETAKMQGLERRRNCELEGYSADLSNMKRKVEFYQKYITKLKQLVSEERPVDDLYSQIKEEASEMEASPDGKDQTSNNNLSRQDSN